MIMNKEALVRAMAQQSGLTQKVALHAVDALLSVVQETLSQQQKKLKRLQTKLNVAEDDFKKICKKVSV